MQALGLGSFVVCARPNVQYLSGFSGSNGWLWVTDREAVLLTDFRYEQRARQEAPDFDIRIAGGHLAEALSGLVRNPAGSAVGFEAEAVTFKVHAKLREALGDAPLTPTEDLVERFREVKDEEEIACIRQATRITDQVFEEVLALIGPGTVERDIAAEVEYRFKRLGGDGPAFETIVASGQNGSMPHAATGDRRIGAGDFVTLDMGACWKGYAADLTRTVVVGTPSPRQKKVYAQVLQAQQRAIEGAKAGMPASELDALARDPIRRAGFGEHFGHGLGHGVGLLVHDPPRVSWMNSDPLRPGMVVTIEPGIYIPGWGGVRIEDVAIIQEDGCEDITKAPKNLISL